MAGPSPAGRRYRIDFALITLTGNLTRYLIVRPLVEADPSVASRWYPIRTWVQGDWLRVFPGHVRLRARHLLDSWGLFVRRPADAVVIHAFETYNLYGLLHWLLRLRTVLVNHPDGGLPKPKAGLRGWLLRRALDRTRLFVAWSTFGAEHIVAAYPPAAGRLQILHPGMPLERWPLRQPPAPAPRFRLLFVGGDAVRKGIGTLLTAFERDLHESCELAVATQTAYLPEDVRARIERLPHTRLFLDLQPGSAELQGLFRQSDAFVLPTEGDVSPWVALEALATGVPVIITPIGGIPDIVRHEETGLLIPAADPGALSESVLRLRRSPELRRRLVEQGRAHVERHYDARVNTARFLDLVKGLVDQRKGRADAPEAPEPVYALVEKRG